MVTEQLYILEVLTSKYLTYFRFLSINYWLDILDKMGLLQYCHQYNGVKLELNKPVRYRTKLI